jgi:hypothetical protein
MFDSRVGGSWCDTCRSISLFTFESRQTGPRSADIEYDMSFHTQLAHSYVLVHVHMHGVFPTVVC